MSDAGFFKLLNESNESQPVHRLSSFESEDKARLQAGVDERTLAIRGRASTSRGSHHGIIRVCKGWTHFGLVLYVLCGFGRFGE